MRKDGLRVRGWPAGGSIIFLLSFVFLLTLPVSAGAVDGDGEELYFTILHTNDEHSALLPSPVVDYSPEEEDPTVGGFARVSRLVNDIRSAKEAEGEPVVLASGADYVGGSPYCWLIPAGEAPELSVMQQVGYDVITVGNHEFDYGSDILAQFYRAGGYPEANNTTALVSSNLDIPEDHPLADVGILDTHLLRLDNGLKLGFFGLMGSEASQLAAKMDPVGLIDPVDAAASAVQTLKEQDADVIIAVTHAGIEEDREVAAAVSDIDVIVGGHCHTPLYDPVPEGDTVIVQAGVRLQYLGFLELAYNPADGSVRVRNTDNDEPFLIPVDDTIDKDPDISDLIDNYTNELNSLVYQLTAGKISSVTDIIAYSDFTLEAGPSLKESVFGNFLTDAMRLVVEERTGEEVDIAIQANGVIRDDVIPGRMPYSLNKISFYDLVTTIGLGTGPDGTGGYPMTSIYLTGNEVYRVLELATLLTDMFGDTFFLQISGLRYSYDRDRSALFQIPFTDLPLPTFRAITDVDIFTGSGLQGDNEEDYKSIPRNDDTLYHMVTDYYVLSFLPLIEEELPFYTVVPKDSEGNEIALEDAIIHAAGEEIKFWEVVVDYALSQSPGEDGIPRVPDYYANTGNRVQEVETMSLLVWPALVLIVIVAAVVLLMRRRKIRKEAAPPSP